MTYEIGQKILVEATVVQPRIDGDGDILVDFPNDASVYVQAANTREIPVEPTKIAFGDVRVGDEVRVTTKCNDGVTVTISGFVTSFNSTNMFVMGSGRSQWIDMLDDDAIELISRPEPEPIKVGDKIDSDQVKTLPVCSVVTFPEDDSEFRTVSVNGLYDADFDTTRDWTIYDGLSGFTVKYIAEQA